jgi:hypothetical protein
MTSTGSHAAANVYRHDGYCPICEAPAAFTAKYDWYRDHLRCSGCRSIVRERALAMVLKEMRPGWRNRAIHESSPGGGGISRKLRQEARNYIASHYFPAQSFGSMVGEFRNENLEKQTFADGSFDIVVSLDVMEHVFRPDLVYREVFRTLRPRGIYIHTFPIYKAQTEALIPYAELAEDGSVRHLVDTPEYHGNPIDAKGSLVTYHYGYDIQQKIAEWAPFRVRVMRFWDPHMGIIGEFTEVVVCERV